jgi:hypothetical protein
VSTTRSLGVASWYAAETAANKPERILVRIKNGAKGYAVPNPMYEQDSEVIVSGKFRVNSVEKVSSPYWARTSFEVRRSNPIPNVEDRNPGQVDDRFYEVVTYTPRLRDLAGTDQKTAKKYYDAVASGNYKSIQTADFKLTNDRPNSGIRSDVPAPLSAWFKESAKDFTLIDIEMIEPHSVAKVDGEDYGNMFHNLFNGSSSIDDSGRNFQKHQQHDQSSHGNWAGGGNLDTKTGLQVQAKQFNNFEDFSRAISLQGMRPRAWHITNKENFNPSKDVVPMSRTGESSQESILFVGDPASWRDYASGRKVAVEYDLTNLKWEKDYATDKSGNQGFYIKPDAYSKLKKIGEFSVDEAVSRASEQQKQMPKSKAEALSIYQNIEKHAMHDQQSHGNWASGGASAKDISGELGDYFGKTLEEYSKSKAREEISKRTEEARKNDSGFENYVLEIIAEKQGFAGKPKIVTEKEMADLQSNGWVTTYRGIQDYSKDTVNVTKDAKTLAQEFREGSYYAGFGASGDGIYTTTDFGVAKGYAGPKGVVLKIAIPPASFMSPVEFNDAIDSHRQRIRDGKTNFWQDDDLGVDLASKGKRAALHYRNIGGKTPDGKKIVVNNPVFVIWDRSMLAVQDTNL